ncbi:uncharacterized protein LOC117175373, partial [Belonocnema kinseyi]|uniref:uncharacterized protein LOC117175373 n=1 Tax=Belonocnema kinseyi TaxID=2817044 RepID=UPI00143DB43B
LPLTPEEAPADGEAVIPCAQGRIVVESARPAQPHFATCSTYRRHMIHSNGTAPAGGISLPGDQGRGAISKKAVPQSPASRPDDLGVTPWYFDDYSMDVPPGPGDQSSYPSHYYNGRENIRPELASTRNSSMENDQSRPSSTLPRKACMDIRDAIALLDETCPNPEASPSLTPRTPRTPLTPYPRNKRARSKSSDNSSNYSNERLSERSVDNPKSHEKEKKRPFLRKIGISKTEDRPFLYKFTPKIIGKPYLEKIGPSRAVEKPFLDQIGSSKTLDKFIFDTPKIERKKENMVPIFTTCLEKQKELAMSRGETKSFPERRRSGKAYLSKMYSFETEDLDESLPLKNHRDPVRVASLNDVLDAGPSSMPHIEIPCSQNNTKLKPISTSAVELVKCRVTTSEEIVSSTTCLSSPAETTSWEYSPRRKHWTKMISSTPKMLVRRRPDGPDSKDGIRSDDSTPNSPTKRTISSVSPELRTYKQAEVAFIKSLEFSPSKTRRQGSEDILDKKNNTHAQIERWGISSDNLNISRETVASYEPSSFSLGPQSEANSLESSKLAESVGKETFKQLQEKFKLQGVPNETYAAFKQRTKGQFPTAVGLRRVIAREKMISPTYDISNSLKSEKMRSESPKRTLVSERCKLSEASGASEEEAEPPPEDSLRLRVRRGTMRSVLRKQDGVDHLSDQESDTNASLKRTKGKILHEPSQETMDLLTELRKVKSLLKTPSMEKDFDLEKLKDVTKLPKKVLLTDKEFCLSFERENSIRIPSKVNTVAVPADQLEPKTETQDIKKQNRKPVAALFEKRCMSLDFVDDERPPKPEPRTISLASGRVLLSETEEVLDSSELALNGDSKSIYSDVFNTPDELEEKVNSISVLESEPKPKPNHCLEVDVGNTLDQKGSQKKKLQPQGRTSDAYEIISPRTTPFRMKKRLGRISVEDTMKQESFTLNKTDCKSVIVQKKTKCFPL